METPASINLKVKTLTPIWTGGAESGTMNRIQETGIIGSLRWWYEAIMRGLGYVVCDPSADNRCIFDQKKKQTAQEQLCPACQIFGATGWKRRFRLIIDDYSPASIIRNVNVTHPMLANRNYQKDNETQTPKWFFPNPLKEGTFTISIQRLTYDFNPFIIAGLLQFIIDWSALGAKTQMGFGIIKPQKENFDTSALSLLINKYPVKTLSDNEYDLRRIFADDRNLRHLIMGTISEKPIASKIKVSRHDSDGIIRVWGFIPSNIVTCNDTTSPSEIKAKIYALLKNTKPKFTLKIWREFNSIRDNQTPSQTDIHAFINSLLHS